MLENNIFFLILSYKMDINEIAYNIALHTDVDDIPSLCQTNVLYRDICNDPYFWRNKFIRDGIPVEGLNYVTNYYKEYKKRAHILEEANSIVRRLERNEYPEDWGVGILLKTLEPGDLDYFGPASELLHTLYIQNRAESPQIIFNWDNGPYFRVEAYTEDMLEDNEYSGLYRISVDQLVTMLYNLISRRVIIYDVAGDDIYQDLDVYDDDQRLIQLDDN